jgi:capsular exopolysaccharide synthesis family protein
MTTSNYPAGYGLAPPAPSSGLPQISLHTLLIALRCWWHIVLPMGLLLAGGAAVIVFYTTKPTYTASTWIEIRNRPLPVFQNSPGDDSQRFVANQIELMRSPPVIEPVIALAAVRSAPEFVGEDDPVLYLRNHLKIRPLGGSDYFVIEFTSKSPAKAALIVDEVAKSYLALHERHDSKVGELTIELLQEQGRHQESEVKRLRDRLQELSKQLTGKDAFPLQGKDERLPTHGRFQQLDSQLLNAEIELLTAEAEYKAENELLLKESFTPPEELLVARVQLDPKIALLKAELTIKKEKREEHKERSVNLAKNTVYQQLEKEIAADEAELKKLEADRQKEIAAEMEQGARLKRQAQIEELQARQLRIAATVKFLKTRLDEEQKDQKEVVTDTLQLEFAWADYRRASAFHEAISNRVQLLQAERRAPDRVTLFRSATIPARPDEEIPYKKMLMAALAAMVVPFGLAVGIELIFCRVASRQQLESYGKIAVVGEITTLPRRLRGQSRDVVPRRDAQLFEESINGLRTYLTLIESTRGRRVLAVTSSISREGKTSLAAQLAVSIANSTGKPTLLIDGDMRSPDIHRIFDVDCGPGLAEVLAGKIPVEEAIETEVSSRLHLLTAGRLSASPHQLTGGGEFANLIEKLRDMYEHIIIDTPPILPASEALLMAGAADASILCVRRDFSRVDQVSESISRLLASGVKVAGAVLNGVPIQNYSYRYGSYYYTRDREQAVSVTEVHDASTAT